MTTNRNIVNVPQETWTAFSVGAKLRGITQAEYLTHLVKLDAEERARLLNLSSQ